MTVVPQIEVEFVDHVPGVPGSGTPAVKATFDPIKVIFNEHTHSEYALIQGIGWHFNATGVVVEETEDFAFIFEDGVGNEYGAIGVFSVGGGMAPDTAGIYISTDFGPLLPPQELTFYGRNAIGLWTKQLLFRSEHIADDDYLEDNGRSFSIGIDGTPGAAKFLFKLLDAAGTICTAELPAI